MIDRPHPSEYNEFYDTYVRAVPEGDVLEILRRGADELPELLQGLSDERALYRYEPEKWSVKEVVGHVIDVEWIFAYRALTIARGDETPLPGMEQDPYVENGAFDRQPLSSLLEQFGHARRASSALIASFQEGDFDRVGTASDNAISVRALTYILAGHELHHRTVLRERYAID